MGRGGVTPALTSTVRYGDSIILKCRACWIETENWCLLACGSVPLGVQFAMTASSGSNHSKSLLLGLQDPEGKAITAIRNENFTSKDTASHARRSASSAPL